MTTRAFCFLAAALGLLVTGLSTGGTLYYLLSLSLLMFLLLGLASALLTLFTLSLTATGGKKTVERGESVPFAVTVRHLSVLPVKSVALFLLLPDGAAASEKKELSAPPFVPTALRLDIACAHRGLYEIGVSAVSIEDLFGLFSFKKRVKNCRFRAEVRPRTTQLTAMVLPSGESGDAGQMRMTEDNASPADVRAWREGDALKKVHWKLSMRKRELMVRNYEEAARPDTLILIDLTDPGSLKNQALTIEDAVCEAAASVAKAQLLAGYPVRMPLMGAKVREIAGGGAADFPAFLSALTRVRFDAELPFDKQLFLSARRMGRTGGMVLICSRLNGAVADFAMQMRRGGAGVALIWVTDNRRREAEELLSLLKASGVRALKLDPWGEGLTEKSWTEKIGALYG